MGIIVNLDVVMAKRKIGSGELAEKIGITQANLSTLEKLCKTLNCQPGDILEYAPDPEPENNESNERNGQL